MQNKDLQTVLVKALSEKRRLSIDYHGERRLIEVHAIGISTKGRPCTRVYQVIGGAVFGQKTGWKMLSLDDIDDIEPVDEFFHEPREGYQRGDKGMSAILAEI